MALFWQWPARRMNMKRETEKRFVALILVVTIVIAVIVSGALPAMAADGMRPIEKTFTFGKYAPEVMIHNAGVSGRSLQANADGSLTWAKKDANKWSQSFIILPAAVQGYYIIQEFTANPYPKVMTYTAKGFRMEYPANNSYGMPTFSESQMFRFKWYTSTKVGTKTVKNCWRLVCKTNSIAFCTGGWSTLRIDQTNWSSDY